MKWLFLLPLMLLSGCSSQSPYAVAPLPTATPGITPVSGIWVAPSPHQVEGRRLQPAQGHLAPGVRVYTRDGFLWGKVFKVAPDHVFPNGEKGGVLFSVDKDFSADDNSKKRPGYWPFKMFDNKMVLKG